MSRPRASAVLIALLAILGVARWSARSEDAPTTYDAAIAPPSSDAGLVDARVTADAPSSDSARPEGGQPADAATPDAEADCAALAPAPSCGHPPVTAQCDGGWCFIPKGCFIMGSPPCEWGRGAYSENENQTTLTHDFWMKQTEVTQAEWTAQGLPNPSATLDSGFGDCLDARCPVGNLTWFEALAFANKMSSTNALPECYSLNGCTGTLGTGMTCASAQSVEASLYACKGYRIPSEAEWEYAARAGTRSAFYAGGIAPLANTTDCEADPVLESIAWFCGIPDAGRTTHPVGLKLPNAWGLFDMSGNAIEPVSDPFEGLGYGSAARTDPFSRIALADASPTVPWRGGLAWTWSNLARSANRYQAGLGRGPGGGLRLVRRGD